MKILVFIGLLIPLSLFAQAGQEYMATLRGEIPIVETSVAPRMEQVENNDVRRKRNYPMQPPTIPHKIDGYQVDLNVNRCLDCHSRKVVEVTQAPMISVTHYMDRDGNFLAAVSPRRYFCSQCHVPQTVATPLVGNDFVDMDKLIKK